MRAVIQRVSEARVSVEGETIGSIGRGWLILLGIRTDDSDEDLTYLLEKSINLRAFPDAEGKMNLSIADIGGEFLVVSQFTLYADTRKGRRPGFADAAPPEIANRIYEQYISGLRKSGLAVATGKFQADMKISLINEGPVTFILDSRKSF